MSGSETRDEKEIRKGKLGDGCNDQENTKKAWWVEGLKVEG